MNPPIDRTMLLATALDYRQRGWSVLPIRHRPKEKMPALRKWKGLQSTPADEATIRAWLSGDAPYANVEGVGVLLGSASGGLVVRDFDKPGSYEAWAAVRPDLAKALPTVKTGRGYHVYARVSGIERTIKLDDGELRSSGAYVVAPPSMHPSGLFYVWIVPLPSGEIPIVDASVFGCERVDAGGVCVVDTQETQEPQDAQEPQETQDPQGPQELHESLAPLGDQSLPQFIDSAIVATVPKSAGLRHRAVFPFARRLKSRPELAGLAANELRAHVRSWHDRALPTIHTREFDETWADFCAAWGNVKKPYGRELAKIVAQARERPDPPCALGYDSPDTRLLIRVCMTLQEQAGDRPFFLASQAAGEAIGQDKNWGIRRLGMLVSDGVLKRVSKGHTGKASEYRIVDSCNSRNSGV